jgi:hypothetical protein
MFKEGKRERRSSSRHNVSAKKNNKIKSLKMLKCCFL